jgi:outer membrane autotransporter protein
LTNTGRISVGDWGEGVALWDIDASTVTNFGTIEAGIDGTGVDIQGDRNELTNWGRIRVDAGLLNDAGLPDAIYVRGNGNVVNLEGHSSLGETGETGKITGDMTDTSGNVNTLNVNFTGLSPEVKADLEDMIAGQVDASGNPLGDTVEFNVRGVDYVVDPMQIHVDLSSYEEEAGTPNQGAIGANLDSLTENPDPGTDFFNLLNAVDESGDIPAALGALSPQGYQLFGDIAVATMSGVTQQIDQRMAFLSEDMPEKRGNLWISGGYKNAKVDADAPDQTKAEFDTNTVVVGADYRVNPNFTIGALFHYSNTDKAKLDTKGSRADVESRGFGVYAGYRQEGIYGNALAVYSSNDYKSTRTVPIPDYSYTAKAKTSGHQIGFGLDGGYDFRISDQLTAGPLAGLQYVRLNVDGFDEKGAYGANLAVDNQTMTSLLGRVGGRLNWNTTVSGNNTFSLDVHAAFQHEFKNDSRDITAAFISAGDLLGDFSVKTTDPKRNSILVGAGFNYDFHGVASIFANYDAQTGQSNWHEQNVRGGVKISF